MNVKREVPIPIRFSKEECQALKEAAKANHDYVSAYVRRAAMQAAERAQKDAEARR